MLVAFGVFGIVILILYSVSPISPNTMYISSNLFPIIVNTSAYTPSQAPYTLYVFNGIKQVNGTECISNVQLTQYVFNYTTQKYQMVWNENITDPSQVYNIYHKVSEYGFPTKVPSGYAPICPSVIENR